MAALTPEDDDMFWENFEIVDQAIERISSSLPSLFEEPRFEPDAPHVELQTKRANRFATVHHTIVCDAAISLHSQLARTGNIASRNACLEASWRMMPIVRQIIGHETVGSMYSYLVVSWTRAFREFGFENNRLLEAGECERARLIIPELKTLSKAIRIFPFGGLMIAPLKSEFPLLHSIPGIF